MYYLRIWSPVYDAVPPPADPPVVDPPVVDPPPAIGDKTFTQDEVNVMMKKDREKHEGRTREALEELNMVKKKADLNIKDRKALDKRINQLEDSLLTSEQLAEKEKEKITIKHEEETTQLTEERDGWKERYTEATIKRSIVDAAVEHEAISPDQIVKMLRPDTQLIEELTEKGDPTGRLIPQVAFEDIDKEGKPIDVKLPVAQAVKRMKDIEKYQNLFKGDGTGGIGGNNKGKGGPKGDTDALVKTDAKSYIEQRMSGKIPLK